VNDDDERASHCGSGDVELHRDITWNNHRLVGPTAEDAD
jgi:hypothetical protein